MATIPDTDRMKVLNTINLNSQFTEYELRRVHEIAVELEQIREAVIAREDS